MKKLIAPFLIGGLALLSLALIDGACRMRDTLAQERAAYDEYKRIVEADHAITQAAILKAEQAITQKDAEIASHTAKVAQYVEKVSTLRAELTALQNAEPAQPDLEAQPLVVNLRAQVFTLTEMVKTAGGIIDEKDAVINALEIKFDEQTAISESWRSQYEAERTLRVQAENLFRLYEHRAKSNKLWRYAAYGAGAVALGAIITK